MTYYIRNIGGEGTLMVRLAPHTYISAGYAMRERIPIGGRLLTVAQCQAMYAAAEGADVAEAA